MTPRVRLVLATADSDLRERLREGFQTTVVEICGEASDADEAVRLVVHVQPDVALLDLELPGGGIRTAAFIGRYPAVSVVMLTRFADDRYFLDALRAGATGFLMSSEQPADLAVALRRAAAGQAILSPEFVTRIVHEVRSPRVPLRRETPAIARRLTAREWEVMDLLAEGLSTDQVARRLFLSPTTVRVHISTVLRKLKVHDRQSALRLLGAPEAGLPAPASVGAVGSVPGEDVFEDGDPDGQRQHHDAESDGKDVSYPAAARHREAHAADQAA